MADTPDEKVAEHLFGAVDGRVFRLNEERTALLRAPDRIAEIDSELAILQAETARLEPRRPRPPTPPVDSPGPSPAEGLTGRRVADNVGK
jgi:hypothetical protein